MIMIGENNPYGDDPGMALYPAPDTSAGYRLAVVVLGMGRAAYLRDFERMNLLQQPRWSAPVARSRAAAVIADATIVGETTGFVLLGSKVARAFGVDYRLDMFKNHESKRLGAVHRYTVLPHPSGLCREWNDPNAYMYARQAVDALRCKLIGDEVRP